MVMGTIDLKQALEGNKETIADKIFGMIENVAPQIMQIATLSAQQRTFDPRVAAAKGFMSVSPDFQTMKNDPAVKKIVVDRLDDYFGWEQTDVIMEVAGDKRPDECPRVENKRYPNGDARNTQQSSQEASNGQDDSPGDGTA